MYPIVDADSENGFIQFVHSLEMVMVLAGMSDNIDKIVAHW